MEWKNGAACAVIISFDFDAEALWSGSLGVQTLTPLSRGHYGARVGMPRIMGVLGKYNVPATFFVPGEMVLKYPHIVKELHAQGHEIGNHGFSHINPSRLNRKEELEQMRKGTDAIAQTIGVKPTGFRSPAWDLSERSVELILEEGFLYDSSMMGDDYSLYRVMHEGQESKLVELPIAWELDDVPYFMFNLAPYHVGLSSPERVLELWKAEFDAALFHEGVFILTMHPQVIGRWPRIQILDQLLAYIQSKHQKVWFGQAQEIAQYWHEQNP